MSKKIVSFVLSLAMIISCFACMSGLSVYAIDNTAIGEPAVTAPAAPAAKTTVTKAEAKADGVHSHSIEEGSTTATHTAAQTFTPVSSEAELTSAIANAAANTPLYIYLANDIALSNATSINANAYGINIATANKKIVICLNGYTLSAYNHNANKTTKIFQLNAAGVELTLCDCAGSGQQGTLEFARTNTSTGTNGGIVYLASGAKATFYGINVVGGAAANGSVVSVASGLFTAYDSNFSGAVVPSGAFGAFHTSNANGRFALYNCNITANSGIPVYIANASAVFRMEGGTLSGSADARPIYSSGTLILTDVTVNGCSTDDTVTNGGTIYTTGNTTITGGTINGASVTNNGGAIYSNGNGKTLSIIGTTINGGYAGGNGGAIYNTGATTNVVIENATINGGNTNGNGGNIYAGSGTITIKDSTISGGQAPVNSKVGGNIFIANAEVILNGTTVTGGVSNLSTNQGLIADNSIAINGANGKLTIQGASDINNVMIRGTNYGVTVNDNAKISKIYLDASDYVDAYKEIKVIDYSGSTAAQTLTLSGFDTENNAAIERTGVADLPNTVTVNVTNNDRRLKYNETSLLYDYVEKVADTRTQCVCGGKAAGLGDHVCDTTTVFTEWLDTTTLPSEGNYYLSEDVTVSAATALTGDLNLDLNGCTVTKTAAAAVFTVGADKTFNLTDSLTGGAIDGNNVSRSGSGGNISVAGTFNMYGGEIKNGVAGTHGGNVFGTAASSVLNILGSAKLSGGTAANSGGNVGNFGGTLTISDNAVITGGSANNGGNVYNSGSGTLTISGNAQIASGSATKNGGNIYNNATAALSGGTYTGGEADSKGGNVYNTSAGTLTVTGGTYTGGAAAESGGNIFSANALNITGATVTGGQAVYGGNIFVNDNSTATVNAAVSGGSATYGEDIFVAYKFYDLENASAGAALTVGASANIGKIYAIYPFTNVTVTEGATVSELKWATLRSDKSAVLRTFLDENVGNAFNDWYLRLKEQDKTVDGNLDVRFIAMVDNNLDSYKKAGFTISIGGDEAFDIYTNDAYTAFYANDEEQAIADYSLATDYFFLMNYVFDSTVVAADPNVTVNAFVITTEDERITGRAVTFKLSDLTH